MGALEYDTTGNNCLLCCSEITRRGYDEMCKMSLSILLILVLL